MKKLFIIVLSIPFIYFSSCNRDEFIITNPPAIDISKGLLILCEGNTSPGSSKLSYYDFMNDTIYQNIYKPGNIGLFPDGLLKYGNYIFITEQGNYNSTGQIIKADSNALLINSSPAGINPYSLTVSSNKIYVTNGPSNKVTVLDVNSLSVIRTVNVGIYPQEIMAYNNRVYVCNTGAFNGPYDSTISVIDALNDSVVATINLRKYPSGIAYWKNNKIIAGINGPAGLIYVIDINTNTVIDSIINPWGFSNDISADNLNNNIYFISYSNHIVKLDLATKSYVTLIENNNPNSDFFYGYSFDIVRRKHYVSNARNFTNNGSLGIYDYNGNLVRVHETGIAPRRLIVK